jgi:acetyl esterase/lipase
MRTDSYVDSADAKPLNSAMIAWFVEELLANPADSSDTRLNLVKADLSRLPPVTIVNAEIDPLRSDGELLEMALDKAGVDVTRRVFDGVTHEFFGMAAVVNKAQEAQDFAGKQLQKSFAA